MFNWIAGFIAVLIVMAFFWPQGNSPSKEAVEQINQSASQSNDEPLKNRNSSFSRADDNSRAKKFKEIDALEQNISALLNEAQALVDELSYTLPEERNAMIVYREVLALSPYNSTATQGIDNISNKLLGIGQRALNNDKLSSANRALKKLINIDQESEQTIYLTSAISNWHNEKKIADFIAQVRGLIQDGDNAFNQQNIISPATKNALYYYEQALLLDASNQLAKDGIDKVISLYRQRTEDAINQQQYSDAVTNLEILTQIDSTHPSIPAFKNTLLQAQNTQDEATLNDTPTPQ